MSHSSRVAAVLSALIAGALLVACGGGSSDGGSDNGGGDAKSEHSITENRGATPKIVIKNGEPVGGVQELEYSAGDQIRFEVDSDVADEIHVHGYDLMKDVPAGGSVSFSFPAEIEGIFEVELEELGEQIAELRVNP